MSVTNYKEVIESLNQNVNPVQSDDLQQQKQHQNLIDNIQNDYDSSNLMFIIFINELESRIKEMYKRNKKLLGQILCKISYEDITKKNQFSIDYNKDTLEMSRINDNDEINNSHNEYDYLLDCDNITYDTLKKKKEKREHIIHQLSLDKLKLQNLIFNISELNMHNNHNLNTEKSKSLIGADENISRNTNNNWNTTLQILRALDNNQDGMQQYGGGIDCENNENIEQQLDRLNHIITTLNQFEQESILDTNENAQMKDCIQGKSSNIGNMQFENDNECEGCVDTLRDQIENNKMFYEELIMRLQNAEAKIREYEQGKICSCAQKVFGTTQPNSNAINDNYLNIKNKYQDGQSKFRHLYDNDKENCNSLCKDTIRKNKKILGEDMLNSASCDKSLNRSYSYETLKKILKIGGADNIEIIKSQKMFINDSHRKSRSHIDMNNDQKEQNMFSNKHENKDDVITELDTEKGTCTEPNFFYTRHDSLDIENNEKSFEFKDLSEYVSTLPSPVFQYIQELQEYIIKLTTKALETKRQTGINTTKEQNLVSHGINDDNRIIEEFQNEASADENTERNEFYRDQLTKKKTSISIVNEHEFMEKLNFNTNNDDNSNNTTKRECYREKNFIDFKVPFLETDKSQFNFDAFGKNETPYGKGMMMNIRFPKGSITQIDLEKTKKSIRDIDSKLNTIEKIWNLKYDYSLEKGRKLTPVGSYTTRNANTTIKNTFKSELKHSSTEENIFNFKEKQSKKLGENTSSGIDTIHEKLVKENEDLRNQCSLLERKVHQMSKKMEKMKTFEEQRNELNNYKQILDVEAKKFTLKKKLIKLEWERIENKRQELKQIQELFDLNKNISKTLTKSPISNKQGLSITKII